MKSLQKIGIKVAILRGDNKVAIQVIADQLGVDQLQADLLPEQRLEAIREFQQQTPTGMASDGINDAPALAATKTRVRHGSRGH